jgi:hypothetical protein
MSVGLRPNQKKKGESERERPNEWEAKCPSTIPLSPFYWEGERWLFSYTLLVGFIITNEPP